MSWTRLYYVRQTQEFCDAPPGRNVIPVSPETIILRSTYLGPDKLDDISSRSKALQELREEPPLAVLRLVPSPDGTPFRSAIVYVKQSDNVSSVVRVRDMSVESPQNVDGIQYEARILNKLSDLQADYEKGHPGFMVTGTLNVAEFWRVKRLELDGLGRNVVTVIPVRPAFGTVVPRFGGVPQSLQGYLHQHFEGLQQALGRSAPFDVVDRANNLTEGIIRYCLEVVGKKPGRSLKESLDKAKSILEGRNPHRGFLLDHLGYHLAHKIRILHGQLHADQSVGKGKEVRPELGLSAAIDVEELLVRVKLGSYQ